MKSTLQVGDIISFIQACGDAFWEFRGVVIKIKKSGWIEAKNDMNETANCRRSQIIEHA